MAGEGESKPAALSVYYNSSSNQHFSLTKTVGGPVDGTVESKSKFLGDLRQAVVSAQEHINTELTARMEEDKAREGSSAGTNGGKVSVDEAKEEENYGEEVQEDDD
jgi:hypothetical protein